MKTSVSVFPANAGWSVSMPVSMKPMVTPAPGAAFSPLSRLTWAWGPLRADASQTPLCLERWMIGVPPCASCAALSLKSGVDTQVPS